MPQAKTKSQRRKLSPRARSAEIVELYPQAPLPVPTNMRPFVPDAIYDESPIHRVPSAANETPKLRFGVLPDAIIAAIVGGLCTTIATLLGIILINRTTAPPMVVSAPPDPCVTAQTHWVAIERTPTVQGYVDHLKAYSICSFRDLAAQRIVELSKPKDTALTKTRSR